MNDEIILYEASQTIYLVLCREKEIARERENKKEKSSTLINEHTYTTYIIIIIIIDTNLIGINLTRIYTCLKDGIEQKYLKMGRLYWKNVNLNQSH